MIRDATEFIVHVCRYCNTLVEDVVSGCQNCDGAGIDIYTTSPNRPLPDALLEACGEHARINGELPESPALMLLDEIYRVRLTPPDAALPPLPEGWSEEHCSESNWQGWTDGGGIFVSASAQGVDVEGAILLTSPREHADLIAVLRHAAAAQRRLQEGNHG